MKVSAENEDVGGKLRVCDQDAKEIRTVGIHLHSLRKVRETWYLEERKGENVGVKVHR